MAIYVLDVPRWRPALLNELMRSVRGRIRLKQVDRQMMRVYAVGASIPHATGKRRVSLHVTLGFRMREFDVDAPWKSLADALVHAGMLVDDSARYLELGPVTFSRDMKAWGTRVILEDLD